MMRLLLLILEWSCIKKDLLFSIRQRLTASESCGTSIFSLMGAKTSGSLSIFEGTITSPFGFSGGAQQQAVFPIPISYQQIIFNLQLKCQGYASIRNEYERLKLLKQATELLPLSVIVKLTSLHFQNKMKKSESSKVNRNKGKAHSSEAKYEQQQIDKIEEEVPQTGLPQDKGGQNVKVAIRIRPMNENETQRGDSNCLKVVGEKTLQINHKDVHKSYDFNYVLDATNSQAKVYAKLNINELIDAAIEGYSATIFAYGQTGSGKTYSMAGKEELFTRDVYKSDQRQGIIPRAIQQLWKKIKSHKNKYSIKASYTEIYNEQIKDLLNLSSGVLHCRWNPANGFFVEDLIIVDCSDVDDMISVLNQGMKNRTSGSHQMNKDSSRSHSIMTFYVITEIVSGGGQTVKKYGKIAFVDLAGSQRLKESKSQGDMIKETGNINKSLFTLGKVIKGLTDKKSKTPYIPYRDSKLTMLLMDSLGGNSKSLMIACASPSETYFDETLSTLNYAARTMNIRNKPVIQMDQKDQIIHEIQQEIQELRRENVYLREQYQRVNKGLPIKIPEMGRNDMIKTALKLQGSQSTQLPPLQKQKTSTKGTQLSHRPPKSDTQTIITLYQLKFQQLKKQNQQTRKQKQQSEQMYKKLMDTNTSIQNKLDNLEQIFLSKKKDEQNAKDQIVTSGLLTQNTELKRKLRDVERERVQVSMERGTRAVEDLGAIRGQNQGLQREIQRLQGREKELLADLQRKK